MQLPFLQRVAPDAAIVPLVMGHQTADTARALGDALAVALDGRKALLIASTDLSHYHDAATASRLDAVVIDHVTRFDAEGLQRALDRQPDHACGGGPLVAVMRAAKMLGARDAVVLDYADSGDVSGDKSAVVGYLAAALGTLHVMTNAADRALLLQIARDAIAAHVIGAAASTYTARLFAHEPTSRRGIRHAPPPRRAARLHRPHRGRRAARPRDRARRGRGGQHRPAVSAGRPAAELPELEIELSLLGPLEPITTPDDIEVGRHGLLVERG